MLMLLRCPLRHRRHKALLPVLLLCLSLLLHLLPGSLLKHLLPLRLLNKMQKDLKRLHYLHRSLPQSLLRFRYKYLFRRFQQQMRVEDCRCIWQHIHLLPLRRLRRRRHFPQGWLHLRCLPLQNSLHLRQAELGIHLSSMLHLLIRQLLQSRCQLPVQKRP